MFSDFDDASESISGGRWVKDENICNYLDFSLTELRGEDPLAGHLPATPGSLGEVTVPAAQAYPAVLVC